MSELSLEQLFEKINTISTKVETFEANQKELMEKDPHKDAKKAEDEKKHEEEKAKRAKKLAAIKKAMEEETDDEKKEAAIKKAMEEEDDEKKESKKAMTDEEKEEKASVANIIKDKKNDIMEKILTANRMLNPANIAEVESRVKEASLTQLEAEWKTIEPFVATVNTSVTTPHENTIPFMANTIMPHDIDKTQLNASSPDSSFAKFTTKELMEMSQ